MKLYAQNILIGNQWQSDKTLQIDNKGMITAIASGQDPDAELAGGPVVPGMVNCHSHAFQRAFAGLSEYRANPEDSFWSWRDIMYKFVAKLSPEDAHHVARYLYLEMLKAGYTTVAEFHYLHHQVSGEAYDNPAEMSLQVIQAARDTGMAICHLPVLYTFAGFGNQTPSQAQSRFIHQTEDFFKLLEQLHQHQASDDLVSLGVAPHSLRAVNETQLKELLPFIRSLNASAPIHIHIAEQLQEVSDCQRFYGARPVEWLMNNFELDQNWCLIHATHLTDNEVKLLAETKAVAGICPTTEANLGDGIFPTSEFLEHGGRIAIGSDSHIAVNVADELRSLEYAQRLTNHQRAVLCSDDSPSVGEFLFRETAANGADVVDQAVGEIGTGKRADLLVLDQMHPSLYRKHDSFVLDASIFACNQLPVRDVMVAGQWQITAGQHTDQEAIIGNYFKVLDRLVG